MGDGQDDRPDVQFRDRIPTVRSFLTAARASCGASFRQAATKDAVLTWGLRQTALRRLDDLGVSGPQAEALLDMEPALGDAWLAYLALAPASVIGDLLAADPVLRLFSGHPLGLASRDRPPGSRAVSSAP